MKHVCCHAYRYTVCYRVQEYAESMACTPALLRAEQSASRAKSTFRWLTAESDDGMRALMRVEILHRL